MTFPFSFANSVGPLSSGTTFLLRNDGSYILRNDGSKIVRNAGGAALIDVPSGFGAVPFNANFYKSGSTYSTDFVAEPHLTEGVGGVVTYYVDIATGNDTNPGTSGFPYKTVDKAIRKFRADTPNGRIIKVKGGTYKFGQNMGSSLEATNLQLVSWDGNPVYLTDEAPTDLTWTLDTSNTYYASCTAFGSGNNAKDGAHVWDGITPDAYGDDVPLALAASLAACRSTPGTFWRDNPNDRIYVHTLDNRAPDANIHVYEGWSAPGGQRSVGGAPAVWQLYMENMHFRGGFGTFDLQQTVDSNSSTAKIKNCSFKYSRSNQVVNISGQVVVAFVNCVASCGYGDVFSLNPYFTAIPQSLEINCELRKGGVRLAGSAANQSSTAHDGSKIVRLNGLYYASESDQVADVGDTTLSWLLGCRAGPGATSGYAAFRVGSTSDSAKMWLDGCTNLGSTYDIATSSAGTMYKRDFTGNNSNTGSGTVTTY